MMSTNAAVVTLGTLPVAVVATRLYLEIAYATSWLDWDGAPPLAALTALAPTLITTVERVLRPEIGGQHIYMGPLLLLIVLVGIAQTSAVVFEDWLIPRPADVQPISERWPDPILRGLNIEHSPDR